MSKKFLISMILIAILFGIGLAVITALIVSNNLLPFVIDTNVAQWAYDIRGETGNFVYWFFRIITEFGHYYIVISFLIIMGIVWKFKSKAWFLAGTVAVSYGLQQLIKALIARPRPDSAMWWMAESSTSFPSGHSITISCLCVLLIYFIITSQHFKKWVKWLLSAICGMFVILVPLSRIILGMHYFTDIIGGLCLGVLVAVLGIIAYNIYIEKKQASNKIHKI